MKEYKSLSDRISLVREKADFPRAKISSSKDGAEYARQFFHDDISIYESFFMIMLNNSQNTIGYVKISQGGITGTLVDVRIITKYAIDILAVAVILVHNHPSGTLKPSSADDAVTSKVKKALDFFDIKVLDHLILTEDAYYSYSDEGKL
jgi:DNA repair protein RadC